jgi:hypothetical protein
MANNNFNIIKYSLFPAAVFYLDSFCLFNGLGEGFAVLIDETDSQTSFHN